jgi:ribosomal 50S subunit-recycling heat shock protein
MTNSTFIRSALKTRVQAPKLVFYGRKYVGGDQCPYSQPVKQNYRLQIRALVAATCALTRKKGF